MTHGARRKVRFVAIIGTALAFGVATSGCAAGGGGRSLVGTATTWYPPEGDEAFSKDPRHQLRGGLGLLRLGSTSISKARSQMFWPNRLLF